MKKKSTNTLRLMSWLRLRLDRGLFTMVVEQPKIVVDNKYRYVTMKIE